MISFDEIKNLIDKSNKIGLSYHVSPDGDAVGSLLALYHSLKKINKQVEIFSKDNLQKNSSLKFLEGVNQIDGSNYTIKDDIDLLIILDCGNPERVSCNYDKNKIDTLCIDHHVSNDRYGKYNYIENTSSSTGEIIYNLINFLNIKIDKTIASCLYTSIITDTGGLRFECTKPKTFNIVSDLVSTGLEFWKIYEQLFLSQKYSKVKLLSLVYDKLKIVDDKICVIKITDEMFAKSGAVDEQTNDIVSYGLTIDNTIVSILIKSFQNKTKISLRSKDDINVCQVAEMFGGGGHIKAAAFVTELSIDEIEKILIDKFRKILNV